MLICWEENRKKKIIEDEEVRKEEREIDRKKIELYIEDRLSETVDDITKI